LGRASGTRQSRNSVKQVIHSVELRWWRTTCSRWSTMQPGVAGLVGLVELDEVRAGLVVGDPVEARLTDGNSEWYQASPRRCLQGGLA
jgi:hypothetical protein